MLLSGAARLDDAEAMRQLMREAVDQLTGDIHSLRSMIAELRPPALDELGLAPALASLAHRTSTTTGLEVARTSTSAASRASRRRLRRPSIASCRRR